MEWITIEIAKPKTWRTPNASHDFPGLGKDIAPRKDEQKSAWAHVPENRPLPPSCPIRSTSLLGHRVAPKVLKLLAPGASRRLQALSMFILHAASELKRGKGITRSFIWCLSFRRAAVAHLVDVVNVPNPHLVEAYDQTHRELVALDDPARRESVVRRLIEGGYDRDYKLRDYTLDELRPLLGRLLEAGLVRSEFRSTAAAIMGP